jgi:hypothetical protein
MNSYFMIVEEFHFLSNCWHGGNTQDRILILTGTLIILNARFQVLTAASMRMAVFWAVAPCSLVEVYRPFRGACCLHHQGDRPEHSAYISSYSVLNNFSSWYSVVKRTHEPIY